MDQIKKRLWSRGNCRNTFGSGGSARKWLGCGMVPSCAVQLTNFIKELDRLLSQYEHHKVLTPMVHVSSRLNILLGGRNFVLFFYKTREILSSKDMYTIDSQAWSQAQGSTYSGDVAVFQAASKTGGRLNWVLPWAEATPTARMKVGPTRTSSRATSWRFAGGASKDAGTSISIGSSGFGMGTPDRGCGQWQRDSTTQSGISGATIVIRDGAGQSSQEHVHTGRRRCGGRCKVWCCRRRTRRIRRISTVPAQRWYESWGDP